MIDTAPLQVNQEEHDGHGAFFIDRDGTRVAEMVFRRIDPRRVRITHTEVDPSLRGLGIARRLLDTAIAWARATETRFEVTCPYARRQFENDPSIGDVLLEGGST
jgi:uncharacterized protein